VPAILCPGCQKLISNDVPQCPFCGQKRPGLWGMTAHLRRLGVRTDFPHIITVFCGGLYVLALLIDPSGIFETGGMMGLPLTPSGAASLKLGMTGAAPVFYYGHWWTVITAIYLHGGLLHIGFNMYLIRNLGPGVVEVFGPARAFVLFNVAGAFGYLVSNMMTGVPTIGASGGVFGLLAALIVYGRRRGSSMMSQQLWQWAIMMFVFGFLMPGINNWAHAGGFAGGWGCAYLMGFIDEQRESTAMVLLAFAFIGVTAIGIILSFTKVTGILLAG